VSSPGAGFGNRAAGEIPGCTGGRVAVEGPEPKPARETDARSAGSTLSKGLQACSLETIGAGSQWPGAPPWRWNSNAAVSDLVSSATRRRRPQFDVSIPPVPGKS
ncbi:hypothetical protein U0070_003101, partial [Myodes glareolus]